MKRVFWITLIAVALLVLVAAGWVARLFASSSTSEPSSRRPRREDGLAAPRTAWSLALHERPLLAQLAR
jgi:hypothetical protein